MVRRGLAPATKFHLPPKNANDERGYPMNWWLVLRHGMMNVRRADTREPARGHVQAGRRVKGLLRMLVRLAPGHRAPTNGIVHLPYRCQS
jgi:hypothetical protein